MCFPSKKYSSFFKPIVRRKHTSSLSTWKEVEAHTNIVYKQEQPIQASVQHTTLVLCSRTKTKGEMVARITKIQM